MFPSRKDWGQSIGAIGRGSAVGFFLGVLPGGGATISSFVSYWLERKISKHPEKFGTGAIEGVAAPESANNAGVGGSFIPLMILGIPTNAIIAMLMGALVIHGVKPGPDLISKYPDIFWGFVASMYIGNALLLFLNLPLIPVWVQILRVPYRVLFPLILLFTIIGAYSVQNSVFDVGLTVFFGLVGYFLKRYGFQAAPLIMAFVLGQMLEESLRQSLIMSQGSFSIFIERPFCLAFLLLTFLFIFFSFIPLGRKLKEASETEEKEQGL
jgi:putative tricarboxylic transport membrane protein